MKIFQEIVDIDKTLSLDVSENQLKTPIEVL